MVMENINVLISFLCDFLLAVTICFVGCVIREYWRAVKSRSTMKIGKVFVSAITSAILCTTIYKLIFNKDKQENANIELFILICFLAGLWSSYLIDSLTNKAIVVPFIQNLLIKLNKATKLFGESWKQVTEEENNKKKKDKENKNSEKS